MTNGPFQNIINGLTRIHLYSLDGFLELLLQASNAGRTLHRTRRDLPGQFKILTNHVTGLAAEHLRE